MIKVLIIQPIVPHYRLPLFDGINKYYDLKVVYGRSDNSFHTPEREYITKVNSIKILKLEYFNVKKQIQIFKPQVVITYGELKQLSNIQLFILKHTYGFKLIIWSQGLQNRGSGFIPLLMRVSFKLSNGVLFYTNDCVSSVSRYKLDNVISLNNTLEFSNYQTVTSERKRSLKKSLDIVHPICGAFISRFTLHKKPRLLLDLMIKINDSNNNIGFIIIGGGPEKPDFSNYPFIYDFDQVWDSNLKKDLLSVADFGFMPYWVGLSVVDYYSNCLPIFTLKKSKYVKQSVEYSYICSGKNGYIAPSSKDLVYKVSSMDANEFKHLGKNALNYAMYNLQMASMIKRFTCFINGVKS